MAVVFRFRNQLTRYMTATGAANNAKRRANNISSFFMADLPSLAMSRLPDQGKDIRDCHHVLEFFSKCWKEKRPPKWAAFIFHDLCWITTRTGHSWYFRTCAIAPTASPRWPRPAAPRPW